MEVMKPDMWQFGNEQYAYRMTTMMEKQLMPLGIQSAAASERSSLFPSFLTFSVYTLVAYSGTAGALSPLNILLPS